VKTGLLWFDDDPGRDLAQKVERAARRHRQKFGHRPNACYVHPSMLNGGPRNIDGVLVASLPTILRHHLWVGEEPQDSLE